MESEADSSTMSSGKRGHNARTQARNSRGQFAPAPELYVLSDDDVNPAAKGRLQPRRRSLP
jgi:hypothetical protein